MRGFVAAQLSHEGGALIRMSLGPLQSQDFSNSGRSRGEIMEQPKCLKARGDTKLIPQGLDTNTILAAYQLLFILCGITSH